MEQTKEPPSLLARLLLTPIPTWEVLLIWALVEWLRH